MKAVAYCRKSTSGTDENGVERQEGSFDRQRAAIEDYAEKNKIQIIRWYEEPVSGKSIRKRKVFKQMAEDAKRGAFKHILFGEYDRFMRNVHEAWGYELMFKAADVKLHFSNLRNDGSESEEIYKDMFRRSAASYSRELARKVLGGMIRKATTGSWLGGVAPYGLRTIRTTDGKVNLVIYEEEAKVVRGIFKRCANGWGHRRIAIWLNDQGIPASKGASARNSKCNRNPDGKWSDGSVRAILRNPVYKGIYRWNKRARVDCFHWERDGKGTIEIRDLRSELEQFKKKDSAEVYADLKKPESEWFINHGNVPVIVEPEIFDLVQNRFRPYHSGNWKRSNSAKYLMSGGLRCTSCGNGISGHRQSKTLKSGETVYYEYYRCSAALTKGTHPKSDRPKIRRERIDDIVKEGILKRMLESADREKVRELFKNRLKRYIESRPGRLSQVEAEITAIENKIARTIKAYTEYEIAIPKGEMDALKARQKELKEERDKLIAEGQSNTHVDIDAEADSFIKGLANARELFDSADPRDRVLVRERFLQKAEIKWVEEGPAIGLDLCWWKIPKVYQGDNSPRLHHA